MLRFVFRLECVLIRSQFVNQTGHLRIFEAPQDKALRVIKLKVISNLFQ